MSVAPTGRFTPDRDLSATVRAAHLATRRVYFALVVVGILEAISLTLAFVQWRRGGSFEPALVELLICAMGAVLLVGLFAVTRKFRIAAGSAVAAGDRLRAVEQELRDSNARYVRAVGATGEGIWEWDITGDTVYHSPTAREILGLEHEHIHPARAWFDSSLHPDDAARLGEVVGRALGAGGRYSIDFRLRGSDGRYRWIRSHAAATLDADGRPRWLSGSSKDIGDERQARQDLSDLRIVLSDSPDGVARADEAGIVTLVNPACSAMLGFDPREMLGRDCRGFVHPDDLPRFQQALSDMETGGRAQCEVRALRSDGSAIELRLVLVCCRSLVGASTGHFCFMTDVTARNQAERALRLSEQQIRAIVEMQTEYICRWRPDGTLTFVNEAYCRCFGKTREELIGRSFVPLIPKEDQHVVARVLEGITADNPSVTIEHRAVVASGETRWHRWTDRGLFDAAGRIEEFQSVGIDITAQKQAEAELRASVQRFQTLAQLAPVGIFQSDERGRNTYVNESWCRLTGLSCEQGMEYGWQAAVHPDDRRRVEEEFFAAVKDDRDFASEFRYRRPDDSVVHAIGTASAIRDGGGHVVGYLGAVADITALKAAEARIRDGLAYQQELARRERALRRELDHRVRNNLTSLLGLIRFYDRSGDPAAMAQVEGKVRAMGEIHDLLAATSGREVELAAIIRRLAELILGAESARRVVIQSPHGAIPAARASALAMIVQELLTNSLKHGAMFEMAQPTAEPDAAAEGGTIEVNWQPRDDGEPGFRLSWCERRPAAAATTFQLTDSERPAPDGDLWHAGGVGLSLIRGLANAELQGRCSFKIEPDGLRFELDAGIPLYTPDPHRPDSVLESPIEVGKES